MDKEDILQLGSLTETMKYLKEEMSEIKTSLEKIDSKISTIITNNSDMEYRVKSIEKWIEDQTEVKKGAKRWVWDVVSKVTIAIVSAGVVFLIEYFRYLPPPKY